MGDEVLRAQAMRALTSRGVARLAGVSLSTVRRIHAGDGAVQVDTLCAVTGAVGLELALRGFPGREPSLRDSGQLELARQLIAAAHTSWRPALEVPVGEHSRSADIVFFGPEEILHVEIERLMLDYQAQYRGGTAKRDALARQHRRPVRLILVVEDTEHNRRVLAAHRPLMELALPAGSREIIRCLRQGRPLGRDGLMWIRRRRRAHGGGGGGGGGGV